MNNKTRFKTYGLLAAVLLVVVGAVWFYTHENTFGTVILPHEAPSRKPAPTSVANDIPEVQPTYKYADGAEGYLGTVKMKLARALKLNDDEVDQLMAVIVSSRLRACELMADHASIIDASETTIKIETRLSDKQSESLEQETFAKMRQIVGSDRWKLLDDSLDNFIRSQAFGFGRGSRIFTFVGCERNQTKSESPEASLPIATAPAINIFQEINYSDIGAVQSGSHYPSINDYYFFKQYYGKIATMVLVLAKEQSRPIQ